MVEDADKKTENLEQDVQVLNPQDEVSFLFSHAAHSVVNYFKNLLDETVAKAKDGEKGELIIDMNEAVQALAFGIETGSRKLQKAFVPLSVQEMQIIGLFRRLSSNLAPDETLTLMKAKKAQETRILGADGKPADVVPKIYIPK